MRNKIKKILQNEYIRVIILVFCFPLIAYILKIALENGRLIGTFFRNLLNN